MTEKRNTRAKKLLAAGTLGVGVAGATAASEGSRNRIAQQQPSQALVFGYEYNPGIQFEVISLLQQGTVDSILGRQVGDDGRSIVSDTADYNGYVVRYQPDQDAGEYAMVFVRDGTLQTGQSYSFGTGVTFFNSEVNLITAGVATGEAEETTPEEEDEEETTPEDEEETTPEEDEETTTTTTEEEEDGETTTTTTEEEQEEVVVETTTTTENGGGG